MKKIAIFKILLLLMFLLVFPDLVFAGEPVIEPDSNSNKLNKFYYGSENGQEAFINYENGFQKMIVSVGLKNENNKDAFWISPIPATPDKVTIDILKKIPDLGGEDLSSKAQSNLSRARYFLYKSQIYANPYFFYGNNFYDGTEKRGMKQSLGSKSSLNNIERDVAIYENLEEEGIISESITEEMLTEQSFGSEGDLNNIEKDVTVYEHLEERGIISEIITAKSTNGLCNYFKNKGLQIDEFSIPVLDGYIGKNFSFVVSWIRSPEESIIIEKENFILKSYKHEPIVPGKKLGVLVTFPTGEIYYPLLLTSIYEDKVIPITVKVLGHVTPEVFQGIKKHIRVRYYLGYKSFAPDELKNFYSKNNKDFEQGFKYTKIEINAPSKSLTNDLWVHDYEPLKNYYSAFFIKHPWIIKILFLVISSFFTGILSGFLVFKKLRKKIFKLGFLGLSNCLSILGLVLTIIFFKTKEDKEEIKPIINEIKQKGYLWKRRTAFVLLSLSLLFLVIFLFILSFFTLFNGYTAQDIVRGFCYSTDIFMLFFVLTPFYPIAFLVLLLFFLFFRRIKPEDKELFEKLKINNYSLWSFQPKDKLKLVFVPVFSISFLIISFLLVKIFELTV